MTKKGSQRELRGDAERHRLERLLEETHAAGESNSAAVAAAKREADDRGKLERRRREAAETSLAEWEEKAAKWEAECAGLLEEAEPLTARLNEARESNVVLRGLLEKMEEGGVVAREEGDAAKKQVVEARKELLEVQRRAREGEAVVGELQARVRCLGVGFSCLFGSVFMVGSPL